MDTFILKFTKRKKALIWLIGIFILFIVILLVPVYRLFHKLPDNDTIRRYQPESTVSSLIDEKFEPKPTKPIRLWVPLDKISSNLQKAVLISEDDTFYHHQGVNWIEMKKSITKNYQRRGYVRGASTITMQLARNAFLSKEKTITRKIREIILARRIEKVLSKGRILELYLNIVEWGSNIYGAEAAVRYYFDKSAGDLDMAEASLLVAMLPNPKRFNPMTRMPTVRKLQKRVLMLLRNARMVTSEEYEALLVEPIYLRGSNESQTAQTDAKSDSMLSVLKDSTNLE